MIMLLYCQGSWAGEDQVFDLAPIVVQKKIKAFPGTYTLNSEALEDLPISSLVEALGSGPIDLQSRSLQGGIQSDFSLRGSNFQQVLILLDGQRINDPQTAHHNSDLPFTREDIENINIIPGVNSALLGPDAIGGAINFRIKPPEDKKLVLELKGGSYKTASCLFSISEKMDQLGVRFSLEDQGSAGFYEDTDYKKLNTSFASLLEVPDGKMSLDFGYQEKEFGAHDFYTPGQGYLSKEWTRTYLFNTAWELDKGGLLIKPGFLWRRHYDKFMLDKTQLRSNYLNHHRTDMYTPNIYLQNQFAFLGRVGFGLEYGEDKINSTNLGKHSRSHESIFLDLTRDLTARISCDLSGRYDHYDSFTKSSTGTFSLKYRLSKTDILHFDLARSIRLPSFTELYYSDPTTLGNNALSPEQAFNYQAGIDCQKEKLFFGVAIFWRNEKDLIDWVKRSSTQEKWQAENISGSDFLGWEGSGKFDFNEHLSVHGNYTYVDKRKDKNGYLYKYGPNYIRHLLNSAIDLKLPWGTQTLNFSYKKKPDRNGWLLVNMRLSYNLRKKPEIFLNITNLFNVEYQEIEGIPQPGRYIEGGLRIEW
jgi:iron complex outermembrane receptor protein